MFAKTSEVKVLRDPVHGYVHIDPVSYTHLRRYGLQVEEGIFAADMKVELLNDGPITIWLDSEDLK